MSWSVSPTTKLLADLASALPLLVILAWFGLHPTIRGHSIRVKSFGLLSLRDIQYAQRPTKNKKPTANGTVGELHFHFRLPRPSDPRWCTITIVDLTFADAFSTVKVSKCTIELSLLPRALGKSAGPWAHLTLDGMDVSVSHSAATPDWVQRVRSDVARTLLTGDILRCDYGRTAIHFTPPAHAPESEIENEMVLSASARGLKIRNSKNRLYDIGAAEWGCRRSWLEGGGAMWLVGEKLRWTKDSASWESGETGWRQIIPAISHVPHSIYKLITDPTAHADVYVPSCRISFTAFRVRDAEMLRQGAMVAHERFVGMNSTFGDALWDMLASVVAP